MKKVVLLGYGISGKAVERYFLQKGIQPIIYEGDGSESLDLEGVDLVVKSPGIRSTHPWAVQAGSYTSELELGLEQLSGKRVIGITGSNGKTTTTLLVAHLLSGYACGNVGQPILGAPDADFYVVELSSFQLQGLKEAPYFDVAALLNITPNHLDWHASMEEYVAAKMRLGNCLKEKGVLLMHQEAYEKYGKGLERVEPISKLVYRNEKFPAAHDAQNIAAAYAICKRVGLSDAEFERRLETFEKPPHRMEFVCTKRGIHFINDSKATSVDAVAKALASVSGSIIWIAGGVDKGGSFAELLPLVKEKVRVLIALGEAKERIARELKEGAPITLTSSLEEGVEMARKEAKAGDTVLLSPGCSSYDQFKSFEERGERFKHYVRGYDEP